MFKATHRMVGTRTYSIWANMISRCSNKNIPNYESYGGRGIAVHPALKTFAGFFEFMGICPEGHSIDRIDGSGNYEPGNVRWATAKDQARNRRSNRPITFNGRTMLMSDWAEEIGIGVSTIKHRIDKGGWSVEAALTTPIVPAAQRSRGNGGRKNKNGH